MSNPMKQLLDAVDWREVEYQTPPSLVSDTLPYVTHEGVLDFSGSKLRVYQLSDNSRVIDCDDLKEFFGQH